MTMTAAELRALLGRARMTQREAAKLCGVTPRTVQNWVAGTTPVPVLAGHALMCAEAERAAGAFERDAPAAGDSRDVLVFVAAQQERRIAELERALEAERSALKETRARLRGA